MKELKSTLQTSHKTTKWTDLLNEPEGKAENGETCEITRCKTESLDSGFYSTGYVVGKMDL